MLAKGYLYGSHFLPHDAMATQKSGKTFLTELNEAGLRNCKAVPRTHDIWVGINRLRQILPRFTFRIPACRTPTGGSESERKGLQKNAGTMSTKRIFTMVMPGKIIA